MSAMADDGRLRMARAMINMGVAVSADDVRRAVGFTPPAREVAMTEAEWLASDDPVAMLAHLEGRITRASDRRLLLFACACRRAFTPARAFTWEADNGWARWEEGRGDLHGQTAMWHATLFTDAYCLQGPPPPARIAAILRDTVGDPFRPVALPPGPDVACPACGGEGEVRRADAAGDMDGEPCVACGGSTAAWDWRVGRGRAPGPCPWLTPQVVSLATAAYSERLPDGSLDDARLAVLSDALEESGLSEAVCPGCGGEGKKHWEAKNDQEDRWFRYTTHAGYRREDWMEECERCKGAGLSPHPILVHLRGDGPFYRGMWSLDLVMGRE